MSDPIKLIVVHGVQPGDDESAIEGPLKLIEVVKSLTDATTHRTYKTATPSYEDYNDSKGRKVKFFFNMLLKAIGQNVAAMAVDTILDIAGDVFVYRDGDDAKDIRKKVTAEMGDRNILVGHSLGSVVTFDILDELMRGQQYKDMAKADWPVESMVTFGSPLALKMFRSERGLPDHGASEPFHWYNYFDHDDPIVSGNVFGLGYDEKEPLNEAYNGDLDAGWHIHDRIVSTGFHLWAHTHYWRNQKICKRVAQLLEE